MSFNRDQTPLLEHEELHIHFCYSVFSCQQLRHFQNSKEHIFHPAQGLIKKTLLKQTYMNESINKKVRVFRTEMEKMYDSVLVIT